MAEELGLFGEELPQPAVPEPEKAPEPAPVEPPAAEPEKPAEPKGEIVDASPASDRPRDDSGRFKKRDDDEHMVPLSALLSERERRQAAEAAAKAQQPTPDIWADPKAFIEHTMEGREQALLAKAQEQGREQFFNYTENAARSRHANESVKYDQAREAFATAAQRNPMMASQLRDAPDPGEFIYQQGKVALELQEVGGDLSMYRKRIETEIIQRQEKERQEREKRNANIPTSLNSEPSKGAGVTGAGGFAGPTPIETIFPER